MLYHLQKTQSIPIWLSWSIGSRFLHEFTCRKPCRTCVVFRFPFWRCDCSEFNAHCLRSDRQRTIESIIIILYELFDLELWSLSHGRNLLSCDSWASLWSILVVSNQTGSPVDAWHSWFFGSFIGLSFNEFVRRRWRMRYAVFSCRHSVLRRRSVQSESYFTFTPSDFIPIATRWTKPRITAGKADDSISTSIGWVNL